MNGRCETDPIDRAVDVCDRCYGEFCPTCLVEVKSRRHPLCRPCAMAVSGVRGTAGPVELRGDRKTAKARRAQLQRAGAEEPRFRYFDEVPTLSPPTGTTTRATATTTNQAGAGQAPASPAGSPAENRTPADPAPDLGPATATAKLAEIKRRVADGDTPTPPGDHAPASGRTADLTASGPGADGDGQTRRPSLYHRAESVRSSSPVAPGGAGRTAIGPLIPPTAAPSASGAPPAVTGPSGSPGPPGPADHPGPGGGSGRPDDPTPPRSFDEAVPTGTGDDDRHQPERPSASDRRGGERRARPMARGPAWDPDGGRPPTAPMIGQVRSLGGRRSGSDRRRAEGRSGRRRDPARNEGTADVPSDQPAPSTPAATDRDAQGNWIPPILRGMAPDAREAGENLPQRRAPE